MSILTDHTVPIPIPTTEPCPTWCDPRCCTSHPDTDDEALVVHRAVLLDEPLGRHSRDRLVVDLVRGNVVCTRTGDPLTHNPGAVRVRGVGDEDELSPDLARRLADAVGLAAYLAGGAR